MGGGAPAPGRLRAHPEEGRGGHALALGGDPERLGLDPAGIVRVVELAALRVEELVADDSVAVGMGAGRGGLSGVRTSARTGLRKVEKI